MASLESGRQCISIEENHSGIVVVLIATIKYDCQTIFNFSITANSQAMKDLTLLVDICLITVSLRAAQNPWRRWADC